MQILKDHHRISILEAAMTEFQTHGFERATMRAIALEAKMSVSNLYKYFSSKHQLFEALVGEYARAYMANTSAFLEEEVDDIYTEENMRAVTERLVRAIWMHRRRFSLLTTKSHGTPYGDFKQGLILELGTHLIAGNRDKTRFCDAMIRIIACNIIDGIVALTLISTTEADFQNNIGSFIRYHFRSLSLFHD